MAWPCITRACCINRFWTELDKGDIAVPLVFTKYSDVADVQHLAHHPQQKQKRAAAASETWPHPEQPEAAKAPPATGAAAGKDGSAASVMRQDFKAWRVRPEPSCKPRNEYQPPPAPFSNETQYQKDYKAWPIPKKHDHPWIPKPAPNTSSGGPERSTEPGKLEHQPAETEGGMEKCEIEEKIQEKESKQVVRREKSAERKAGESAEEQRRSRAAADALNKQIKEVMSTSSSYRTEFKAYKDVKPVKPIKAPSQYKPPGEETSLETSYSATFKGEQVKGPATDNKLLERRRIRSLYNEPGKEPAKVDKPVSRTKPRKAPTTTTGKTVKKAKEKQISSSQSAKKKPPGGSSEPKPDGAVSKKSKEISNRLAEANQ
ncbi:microtubule-associated protein 6 homolog isoform X1 [Nothobranchius furzeri]|uniref:Microtubule-associated protein 6b n=1 Tax=Nothobranchius furzeri TaxID=105023 RepID=A0A8C6NJJ3_NOTFU|nr:microtubule-associated protein 6 homolog isoform X1 [Nothobranchius furzeri]KAF7218603.1 transcript variant X1 [Nothobranchius furzeri]